MLVVNGVDLNVYGASIWDAYVDSTFSGYFPFSFWDCFAETGLGYPSQLPAPLGHGAIPAHTLKQFSTVVWVGNNYNGDIASWSPRLVARMARWVDEFKAVRHLMAQDFYQLLDTPGSTGDWDAVQFVSYNGDEAVVFVFAGDGGGRRSIRPRALANDKEYLIRRRPDGEVRSMTGDELRTQGLRIRLKPNEGGLWRMAVV